MKKAAARFLLAVMILSFVFSLSAFADNGVLQSSRGDDAGQDKKSSQLVPSDAPSADPESQESAPSGPTIKLTFKSQSQTATASAAPAAPAAPGLAASTSAADIFQTTNPHATQAPPGTSPFVQQVGAQAPGYQQQPVVSYGSARGPISLSPTSVVKKKTS